MLQPVGLTLSAASHLSTRRSGDGMQEASAKGKSAQFNDDH
jgi:hypothetical protein